MIYMISSMGHGPWTMDYGLWTIDHRPKTEIPPRGRDFTQTDKAIEETEFSIFIDFSSAVKL